MSWFFWLVGCLVGWLVGAGAGVGFGFGLALALAFLRHGLTV